MPKTEASPTKIIIDGRFSFLHLFEPRIIPGSTSGPKYSGSIMVPLKDTAMVTKVDKAIAAAKELGVKKCKKWDGEIPEDLQVKIIKKFPKGSTSQRLKKNPEYAGMMVISASSKDRPGVVDESLEDIIDSRKIQSGDSGRFEVNFFPYEQGSNGIGCGLNHVQFLEEGEHFSSRGTAADAFSEGGGSEDDDADSLIG